MLFSLRVLPPPFPGCHAALISHIQERAQEPGAAVPATTRRADHRGRAVEPDAKHLPQRGDSPGQREARLGDPVSGAAADDGCSHPRGEQVRCSDKEWMGLRL